MRKAIVFGLVVCLLSAVPAGASVLIDGIQKNWAIDL
jgi:hypothetical protein